MSLLFLTFLSSVQMLFTKENIIELTTQTDLKELMGSKKEREIYTVLERAGLSTESAQYVLEHTQTKAYMGTYFADSLDAILYQKDIPKIKEEELIDILQKTFQDLINEIEKGNIETEISSQEQELIEQKIAYFAPAIAESIPDSQAIIDYKVTEGVSDRIGKRNLKITKFIISLLQRVLKEKAIISIVVLVQLFLIFLIKHKKFHYIKWYITIFFITGILLFFAINQFPLWFYQHLPSQLTFMKNILEELTSPIYKSWNQTFAICLILCFLLIACRMLVWILHLLHDYQGMEKL